jgi:hypothetical protein
MEPCKVSFFERHLAYKIVVKMYTYKYVALGKQIYNNKKGYIFKKLLIPERKYVIVAKKFFSWYTCCVERAVCLRDEHIPILLSVPTIVGTANRCRDNQYNKQWFLTSVTYKKCTTINNTFL